MKFNSTRSAQSKIPGMGRLPGVLVFQRLLSIRQTYLYAKNEIITHFIMRLMCACGKFHWWASTTTHCVWFQVCGCGGKSISTRVLQDQRHSGQSQPCTSCRVGFLPILFWSSCARDRHGHEFIGCIKSNSKKKTYLSGELIADALGFA